MLYIHQNVPHCWQGFRKLHHIVSCFVILVKNHGLRQNFLNIVVWLFVYFYIPKAQNDIGISAHWTESDSMCLNQLFQLHMQQIHQETVTWFSTVTFWTVSCEHLAALTTFRCVLRSRNSLRFNSCRLWLDNASHDTNPYHMEFTSSPFNLELL